MLRSPLSAGTSFIARSATPHAAPWVIVAGGVHLHGGTDKANYALVEYLLSRGIPVHLVTHNVDADLARDPRITVERAPVPAKSWFAGEMLLSMRGRKTAKRITAMNPKARVVVNGGNCIWSDINWVHYVHHAWSAVQVDAPWSDRMKHRAAAASAKRRETKSIRAASLIVTNADLTSRHVTELLGIESRRVHTVYLGAESDWAPATEDERNSARAWLGRSGSRPLVLFSGGVGYDNRKGLDILWDAWQRLCRDPGWDADLIVAGDGRALPEWRAKAAGSELRDRARFLGFTERVPELLAAADLVVSPARYESFGLNVQEALCEGVPTIVSAGAGVAERYSQRCAICCCGTPRMWTILEGACSCGEPIRSTGGIRRCSCRRSCANIAGAIWPSVSMSWRPKFLGLRTHLPPPTPCRSFRSPGR